MYAVRTYRTRARAAYVRRTARFWKIRVRDYYGLQHSVIIKSHFAYETGQSWSIFQKNTLSNALHNISFMQCHTIPIPSNLAQA